MTPGFALAKRITRKHAKSFYFASFALLGKRRRAAFALYAFCRGLDDLVDESPPDSLSAYLGVARVQVSKLFGRAQSDLVAALELPWPPSLLIALSQVFETFAIPEQPFQELISGMEMDLAPRPYQTFGELEVYCQRVAGTVGLMMTPVLGYASPEALAPAATLGRAMQLTNILRDVGEDLGRGRLYLPQDELDSFGVSRESLEAGRVDANFRKLMKFQIERARQHYLESAKGLPYLTGFGTQWMVRMMGSIYGRILNAIEDLDYDVFSQRARVGLGQKMRLAARTALHLGRNTRAFG